MRIQVIKLPPLGKGKYFNMYHGELLSMIIRGVVKVSSQTQQQSYELSVGDQVFFVDGEGFKLEAITTDALVQMIWSPGPNPCKFCWENSKRFFE